MNQLVKVGIAFGLLVTVIAVALVFRKTPVDEPPGAKKPALKHRENVAETTPPDEAGVPRLDGRIAPEGVTGQSPSADAADRFTQPEPSNLNESPPKMAAFYPSTKLPFLVPLPSTRTPSPSTQPAPAAPLVVVAEDEEPLPGQRRHKIRDGDTLVDLAQRYLGDGRRAQEIFDANRNLLKHPDLLPIGGSLLIPRRRHASSPAEEAPAVESDIAGPLVPVAPVPGVRPRSHVEHR